MFRLNEHTCLLFGASMLEPPGDDGRTTVFLKVDDRKFAFARLSADDYVNFIVHPEHFLPVANQWLDDHKADCAAAQAPSPDRYRPRAARRAQS